MKNVLIRALFKGYATTRKNGEIPYFLRDIFTDVKTALGRDIVCNKNKFWLYENIKNREKLISDLQISDFRKVGGAFHIINEYEHGDAYGIEKFCKKEDTE